MVYCMLKQTVVDRQKGENTEYIFQFTSYDDDELRISTGRNNFVRLNYV